MNRLEELLLLWQDQSLEESGLAELTRLLETPEARAYLVEHILMTGVVLEALRTQSAVGEFTTGKEVAVLSESACPNQHTLLPGQANVSSSGFCPAWHPHFRKNWRGRIGWLAGTAAALLVVLGSFLWFQRATPPRSPTSSVFLAQVTQVEGEVVVITNEKNAQARAGQVLQAGQGIATLGADSEAVVQMGDHLQLKLGAETMLNISLEEAASDGALLLVLEQGELTIEANRRLGKKPVTVETPMGTVIITKTEDTALHVSEAVGVAVARGEAEFVHKATGKSIRVRAGQYLLTSQPQELGIAELFAGSGRVWAVFSRAYVEQVSVAFSPDGRLVAGAYFNSPNDQGVRLGFPEGEKEPLKLTGCRCVGFSPDGRLLATSGGNKVLLYETTTGQLQHVFQIDRSTVPVSCLTFSPNGQFLAVGKGSRQRGGTVELWDITTGKLVWTVHAHPVGITCLAFSPDGQLLATGSGDKTVALWNAASGAERTRILLIPAQQAWALAFSPTGETLAIATGPGDARFRQPGEIKLWDVGSETVRTTLRGHGRAVTSLAFSTDGTTLVSGSADTTVRFWDLAAGREYGMLKGHKAAVGFEGVGVALSPDLSWLATISFDGTVKLWKLTRAPKEPGVRLLSQAGTRALPF